ncbi:MAG: 30S ribosomal protein S16, partial [Actinomycetes bacterium]
MAVKIKLKRLGKIRNPQYRVVIADARTARDGRAIEEIGLYHPKEEPSLIQINSERVQYWLSVGAQPTEPVLVLLKITGDWQKFKGLPGAEGTLRVAESKTSKLDNFAATVLAVANEPRVPTIKPKAEPKVEVTEAEVAAVEAPVDAPAVDAEVTEEVV